MPQTLHTLDFVAIGIYIALMAGIGLSFGWFVKGAAAYFKGDAAIPWTMSAISNFMAWFSTFVFIAYGGIAYEHGLVAITVYWTIVPACILGAIFFAARWRRTGITTPTEYLETRYNLALRQTVGWVGLIMRFLDNMIRLYTIGLFVATTTQLSLGWSVVVSGVVVTVFNLIGGVWSVVVMGVVQFVILMLSCAILVPLSLAKAGGFAALYERIPQHMTWFNGPKGQAFFLIVFGLMLFIKVNENWTIIQRYYCVRDEKAALKVGVWTGILFFFTMPIFLLPAVCAKLILPPLVGQAQEQAYPLLAMKLLPPGIMGILFCSMFAATMSTLNAEYNVMAGVFTNDVYKRLINPRASEKQLLLVGRVSTAVVGLLVIAGAAYVKYFGGAFEANKLFTGILAIPLGVPLILGIVAKKPGSTSSALTIAFGIVAGVVLNAMPGISWEWATLIETVLCLAIYFYPAVLPERARSGVEPGATAFERAPTGTPASSKGPRPLSYETPPLPRRETLDDFFNRLQRPIPESAKPRIAPETRRSIVRLFVFAMTVSGGLFIAMSVPSIDQTSGKLALASGLVCVIGAAALLWLPSKEDHRTEAGVAAKQTN